jgi:hypothetical protein
MSLRKKTNRMKKNIIRTSFITWIMYKTLTPTRIFISLKCYAQLLVLFDGVPCLDFSVQIGGPASSPTRSETSSVRHFWDKASYLWNQSDHGPNWFHHFLLILLSATAPTCNAWSGLVLAGFITSSRFFIPRQPDFKH